MTLLLAGISHPLILQFLPHCLGSNNGTGEYILLMKLQLLKLHQALDALKVHILLISLLVYNVEVNL
jgi:hypothetical protein